MDLSALADIDVDQLSEEEVRELLKEVEAAAKAERFGQFRVFFPEEGPLSRHNYPKHMEFFRAGKTHTERAFIAANRAGKSIAGCYETTAHLTGEYPAWWEGRTFNKAISAWAAGDTNETTRDILQKKLMGGIEWHGDKKGVDGSGMIPRDRIIQDAITWKAGVPDLIDTVKIEHTFGDPSVLGFKSYAQGRKVFQGTEQDLIFFDEEPPQDCYNEALVRLMTTKGIAMLTFTPLNGWSDVVESFYPEKREHRR